MPCLYTRKSGMVAYEERAKRKWIEHKIDSVQPLPWKNDTVQPSTMRKNAVELAIAKVAI